MDIKWLLKKYLAIKGITVYRFEKDFSLYKGWWIKNPSIPTELISKIAVKYSDLDILWLLTGDGSMLKPSSTGGVQNSGSISGSTVAMGSDGNVLLSLPETGKQKIIDASGDVTTLSVDNADKLHIEQFKRENELLTQRIAELERTILTQEKLIAVYEKSVC